MRLYTLKQGRNLWAALYVTPGACPSPLPKGARIVPVTLREAKPTRTEAREIARVTRRP